MIHGTTDSASATTFLERCYDPFHAPLLDTCIPYRARPPRGTAAPCMLQREFGAGK